ncbi:MAG: lipid II:glycine glycyltransferase FemX, partial [Spirochaetia bacterium]
NNSLLQTEYWGRLKSEFGWQVFAYACTYLQIQFTLLVLVRKLTGVFHLAYVPHGPDCQVPGVKQSELLQLLSKRLKKYLPGNTVVLRWDPKWSVAGEGKPYPAFTPPLKKAVMDIQPPNTVVVNLEQSEDEILKAMKSKTRYNVRLAAKKGVTVRKASFDEYDTWYNIYQETAQRDKIAIHSAEYYKKVWELAWETEDMDITLLFAEHEGEVLAGNFIALNKEHSVYLYGASSGKKRSLMPAYALQWEAMKLAKSAGCTEYDLFGIPPKPDKDHPMYGLYRFKTGFGGQIRNMPGAWDYPLSLLYPVFRLAERLRKWYFKSFQRR